MGRAAKMPLNKKENPLRGKKCRKNIIKRKRKTKQTKHTKLKGRARNECTSQTQGLESIKETIQIHCKGQ